jgi:hypothetical protein
MENDIQVSIVAESIKTKINGYFDLQIEESKIRQTIRREMIKKQTADSGFILSSEYSRLEIEINFLVEKSEIYNQIISDLDNVRKEICR